MVSRLTLNLISFFKPLLMKTFVFFCLALRTISLFAVFPIKLMFVFAMCLRFIYSTNRVRIFERVLFWSNNAKMFYVNAVSIFTNMINHHSGWNISIRNVVGKPMSTAILLAKVEVSIPISIKGVLPNMAIFDRPPIAIEPLYFSLFSICHIAHYKPY